MKPRRSSSLLALALACAGLAGSLSACAPLMVGGAAAGAVLMATDRRTTGIIVEDERIELRAASAMREAFGDRAHVNVSSYNRQVLLTGEVPDAQAKERAEQIAARIENVKGVANELGVLGVTSLQQRSNDVLVSGKVRASFVDASDLQANAFRVVTERGSVYLMGRVTQREADRATQIARSVPGVQRVVRIFEYVGEDEVRRSQASAPAAPAASATR